MKDLDFESTLHGIEQRISDGNFKLIYSQYNPEAFGNYYIDISNGKFFYRLIRDRSQYYLEGKTADSNDWQEINKFVATHFSGSILLTDLKLHKVGQGDFTLQAIQKLLSKLLFLSEKRL
jgi:hypothetical protein